MALELSKSNVRVLASWCIFFCIVWHFWALSCTVFDFIFLPLSDPPAPRYGVKNLRINEETTFSIRVSWEAVDSRNVRHYRLNYISVKGDRAEETVRRAAFAVFHSWLHNNWLLKGSGGARTSLGQSPALIPNYYIFLKIWISLSRLRHLK